MSPNDCQTRAILEPQEASPMTQLSGSGSDMATPVLPLVGMEAHGTILVRTRLERAPVMALIAPLACVLP